MSGTDIFIAILCGVMLLGGLYLNVLSRKLSNQYFDSHRPESVSQKGTAQKKPKKG